MGATVEKLQANLASSTAVLGFSFQGLSVTQMEALRKAMPEDADVVVCKNKLMLKAVEDNEEWAGFDSFCTGSNAFMFIREDIPAFEKLPSKQQLIAMIAGATKAVPTKVAVGVRQVPTKLAVGVKKISEGDSEPSAQAAAQR